MYLRIISIIFSVLISGCGINPLSGLGFETDTPKFWAEYNRVSAELDQQAKSGKITWVQAAIKRKEADKFLASTASKYDTSWKFDSSDEEFHGFCIALAERLDMKQISFYQYDSARITKFNEIRERQQSISAQQQQNSLMRQNQQILRDSQNRTITCDTFGSTTTCR